MEQHADAEAKGCIPGFLGKGGREKGNREFVLLCWSFFLNRELFWRLGVGYTSYGQLPRFDSLQK